MPGTAAADRAGPGPCAVMTAICLAAVPAAVPAARHRVRDALQSWRVAPQTRDAAMLITSELVTNAVQFGQDPAWSGAGPAQVCLALWRLARSVLIEVSDSGPAAPVLREADPDAERGRGLQLVAALSERWGCHHPAGGRKVIWASLPLDADSQPERGLRASAAEGP